MTARSYPVVGLDEVVANRRRGGALRVLLSPATVGATAGFLGVATVAPGERVTEHYHPYSEEFLFVIEGSITLDLDDVPHALTRDQALLVPIGVRHRLRNTGSTTARVLFHLGPLAPSPALGHVDTESTRTEHADSGGADAERVAAGQVEVGRVDAGRVAAGRADTGQVGGADAGRVTAGQVEVGQVAAGRADAGQVEVGRVDIGPVDAGRADTGQVEIGSAVAGRADAGQVEVGRVRAEGAP